jgi:uncharacterized protein
MRPAGRPIFTFLVLLALLSTVPDALLLITHDVAGGLYMSLFMWTPGLAAIITCAIHRLDVGVLGWNWRTARHKTYSYVLPLAYIVPVYVATWLLIRGSFNLAPYLANGAEAVGFPGWPRLATFWLDIPLLLTFGVFSRFPNTLGEELGWRGFLLPQLSRQYGFTTGCFVTGVVWALWHYPLLFAFGYFSRNHAFWQIAFFTIMVIGSSFVIGWLRFKTDSLWPCVLLHASHNVFLQTIFNPLTAPVGKVPIVTGEFGGGLALTVGVVGFYLWGRRKELRLEQPT